MQLGSQHPDVVSPLPGRQGDRLLAALSAAECPALTARRARRAEASGALHDPIVWAQACGANVVDSDGNRYVDLTAGFGAAAVGHRHPRVVAAIQRQSERLLHALGDVHPADVKVQLLQRLAELAPFRGARAMLGLSGSDAVEAALKTALLATGRPGIVAFEGGYHGLGHGPLAACGYRSSLRAPFAGQLNPHVAFAPYPGRAGAAAADTLSAVMQCLKSGQLAVGAVLIEPVLGRGGIYAPPEGFMAVLADLCRAHGALLVFDEVMTGLGRTGATWRAQREGVEPDLVCAGKALGGGMPVSACLGRGAIMTAWGEPGSEALHTGTFFGHPLGCAAALAALDVLEGDQLAAAAARTGTWLLERLRRCSEDHPCVRQVRGTGMMLGVELDSGRRALRVVRSLLERGYLTLTAGLDNEVLSLTPPLTIDRALLEGFACALEQCLERERRDA